MWGVDGTTAFGRAPSVLRDPSCCSAVSARLLLELQPVLLILLLLLLTTTIAITIIITLSITTITICITSTPTETQPDLHELENKADYDTAIQLNVEFIPR